jgi:HEAT repeat protein
MKIDKRFLTNTTLTILALGVAVLFWLAIRPRDPVDRFLAAIKEIRAPSDPDEYIDATNEIKSAGLANAAAPRVLPLLDDENPEVRGESAHALAQIGADGSLIIPKLMEKRFDPDPDVRQSVLLALGEARPTSDALIDALMEETRENDPHIRLIAASALGRMGPRAKRARPIALPILIQALDNPRTKNSAAYVLGDIGPEAQEAIPKLRRMAIEDSEFCRINAARALWKIGDTDFVITTLIDLLKFSEAYGRCQAAKLLGEIGPPAELAIPDLEEILDNPPKKNPELKVTLPPSSSPATGMTLDTITPMTEEAYSGLRNAVLEALRKIRNK